MCLVAKKKKPPPRTHTYIWSESKHNKRISIGVHRLVQFAVNDFDYGVTKALHSLHPHDVLLFSPHNFIMSLCSPKKQPNGKENAQNFGMPLLSLCILLNENERKNKSERWEWIKIVGCGHLVIPCTQEDAIMTLSARQTMGTSVREKRRKKFFVCQTYRRIHTE